MIMAMTFLTEEDWGRKDEIDPVDVGADLTPLLDQLLPASRSASSPPGCQDDG